MDIRIQQIKKKLNVYDEYTDYQGTYEKKTKSFEPRNKNVKIGNKSSI